MDASSQAAAPSPSPRPLLPLPASLVDKVAVDRAARAIYVDHRCAGDPQLLTWQDRNRSAGIVLHIKPCDVDEVAKYRASGMRVASTDDDELAVRNHAIEIIATAAQYGASDIHIMMRGDYSEFQIVVKGGLRVLNRLTQAEGQALVRSIYQGIAKVRSASYNPLEFQNAQIPGDVLPADTGLSSIRIIRGPSYPLAKDGAFMTLRLQYSMTGQGRKRHAELRALELPRRPDGEFGLIDMGYTGSQIEKIRALMDAPNGLVIFTGPTGSGKTTTLYEVLREQARTNPQRRLVTTEDPVEYPMDWAVQMLVDAKNDKDSGHLYSERVHVALRMAPDIMLIGEIRGPEVAIAAIEASVTGHQAWTTMHVTDPFLFVERLEIMDRQRLDRRVFCDHKIVRGVIAQRLLAHLCRKCRQPLSENPDALSVRLVNALSSWGDISKVRIQGVGCEQCGHDGTIGRLAVAEVVLLDAAVMSDFIQHGSDVARAKYRARSDADPSMLETAIRLALDGLVDPREVENRVDLIEPMGTPQ